MVKAAICPETQYQKRNLQLAGFVVVVFFFSISPLNPSFRVGVWFPSMTTRCCAKEAMVVSEHGVGHNMSPSLLSLKHEEST